MADTYEANWALEGLFVIADAIKAKREDDYSLVLKNSGEDFVCPTFEMRAFCWCDGSVHPDGCPVNFLFGSAGFWIAWREYAGREMVANLPKPPGMRWELAVATCIRAVDAWAPA